VARTKGQSGLRKNGYCDVLSPVMGQPDKATGKLHNPGPSPIDYGPSFAQRFHTCQQIIDWLMASRPKD
jgi:hypothetical protein